jgi:hypothetical protein
MHSSASRSLLVFVIWLSLAVGAAVATTHGAERRIEESTRQILSCGDWSKWVEVYE